MRILQKISLFHIHSITCRTIQMPRVHFREDLIRNVIALSRDDKRACLVFAFLPHSRRSPLRPLFIEVFGT